jgi:hypothetical protein
MTNKTTSVFQLVLIKEPLVEPVAESGVSAIGTLSISRIVQISTDTGVGPTATVENIPYVPPSPPPPPPPALTYDQTILATPGLVAYYKMGDQTVGGNTLPDSSGNDYNGSVSSLFTQSPSILPNGSGFSALSGPSYQPTASAVDAIRGLGYNSTLEGWFYPTQANQNIAWMEASSSYAPGLSVASDGHLNFDSSGVAHLVDFNLVPAANHLYYVAVAIDANGNVDLCVNGVQDPVTQNVQTAWRGARSPSVFPGGIGYTPGGGNNFVGYIQNVAYYNTYLSSAVRRAHYLAGGGT